MVLTPWGDSGSLRERKLRPVRGVSASEVERNQRERLFAAIIACVAERGFAATTVEDLVELSGVSRRSFYAYFEDKADCLRAAIEESFSLVLRLLDFTGEVTDLEAEGLRAYEVLIGIVASQPAAAKVCLSDAFEANREAAEPLLAALRDWEEMAHRACETTTEHAGTPEDLIRGRIGGLLEIARARLRSGTQDELGGLARDVVDLAMGDRPPPEPLRLTMRPPKAKPESLDAADHSERAIRAFAMLAAERGYRDANIEDVVRLASMSTTTFYANFAGKEDLMAAAIDSACAQALAAVVPAFNRQTSWPDAVRAGFGALLNFLASRPALTRLVAVEVYAAGDKAIERRASAMAPLGSLIENNTTIWGTTPSIVFEMIAGGVAHLIHDTVRSSGPEALPALAPICTYLTLSPFLGPAEACAAANGGGARADAPIRLEQAPQHDSVDGAIGLTDPMRLVPWLVLTLASTEPTTLAEIAAAADADEATVLRHVEKLRQNGMLAVAGDRDGETLYTASPTNPLNIVSERQMASMDLDERTRLMAHIWNGIRADGDAADVQGIFAKPETVLLKTPMRLDDRGWRELTRLHTQMLSAALAIAERSERRLEDSGEPGLDVRSMQLAFELRDEDGPPEA